MATKHSSGKRTWTFESFDKVSVYVSIDPKKDFYFVDIRANDVFKAAHGGGDMKSLLLFTEQQLHRIGQEGLLSIDGEEFLNRCMRDVKV